MHEFIRYFSKLKLCCQRGLEIELWVEKALWEYLGIDEVQISTTLKVLTNFLFVVLSHSPDIFLIHPFFNSSLHIFIVCTHCIQDTCLKISIGYASIYFCETDPCNTYIHACIFSCQTSDFFQKTFV